MSTIAGVRILPGFFKVKRQTNERRVGADPGSSFKIKGTVVRRPRNPKAKYAMPVIAVVAAIVSVAGAASAVGAVVAGAALTASTVFAVIGAVGAVTAAVGAVTGNAKLLKIGAVIGLVGGIGSFATSSGIFGSDTLASGATQTGADTIAPEAASNASSSQPIGGINTIVPPDASAAITPPAAPGMIGDATQAPVNQAAPAIDPSAVAPTTTGDVSNAATTAMPIDTQAPISTTAPAAANNGALPDGLLADANSPVAGGVGDSYKFANGENTPGIMPKSDFGSLSKMFSKLGDLGSSAADWVGKNPGPASMLFQGVSNASDQTQRDLRTAQAGYYNSEAAITNQRRTNMAGVGGVIDWSKVFTSRAPVAGTTTGQGMITKAYGG